jgi:hypothetical protein
MCMDSLLISKVFHAIHIRLIFLKNKVANQLCYFFGRFVIVLWQTFYEIWTREKTPFYNKHYLLYFSQRDIRGQLQMGTLIVLLGILVGGFTIAGTRKYEVQLASESGSIPYPKIYMTFNIMINVAIVIVMIGLYLVWF